MIQEGLKNVTSGANPVGLREGIDKAVRVAVQALHDISQKLKKNEIARRCNFCKQMKKWIKLVMMVLLPLKESNGLDTELEVVEGMQFDRVSITIHGYRFR